MLDVTDMNIATSVFFAIQFQSSCANTDPLLVGATAKGRKVREKTSTRDQARVTQRQSSPTPTLARRAV